MTSLRDSTPPATQRLAVDRDRDQPAAALAAIDHPGALRQPLERGVERLPRGEHRGPSSRTVGREESQQQLVGLERRFAGRPGRAGPQPCSVLDGPAALGQPAQRFADLLGRQAGGLGQGRDLGFAPGRDQRPCDPPLGELGPVPARPLGAGPKLVLGLLADGDQAALGQRRHRAGYRALVEPQPPRQLLDPDRLLARGKSLQHPGLDLA